jgi:hypothetical protein
MLPAVAASPKPESTDAYRWLPAKAPATAPVGI